MSAEGTYLQAVERHLRDVAPQHRTAVIDDLREHIADATEAGRPIDEVIAGLGTPDEIAAQAREQFGDPAGATAERAWRMLQGAAVIIAVITGVLAAFVMPSYLGGTDVVASDGTVLHTDTTSTLAQVNGLWVALIALVPALVAATPLVVPRRARVLTAVLAGAVLLVMALVGGFTLGGFFLPTAMLNWAALIVWSRLRGSGFGVVARIIGAVLTATPVLLALGVFGSAIPGRYADGGPSVTLSPWAWPLLAGILVLAVLIGLGIRTAGWVLAALGLVVLLAGLFSGGLLTLLFVWLGGWWVTIGLAHAVVRR